MIASIDVVLIGMALSFVAGLACGYLAFAPIGGD